MTYIYELCVTVNQKGKYLCNVIEAKDCIFLLEIHEQFLVFFFPVVIICHLISLVLDFLHRSDCLSLYFLRECHSPSLSIRNSFDTFLMNAWRFACTLPTFLPKAPVWWEYSSDKLFHQISLNNWALKESSFVVKTSWKTFTRLGYKFFQYQQTVIGKRSFLLCHTQLMIFRQ